MRWIPVEQVEIIPGAEYCVGRGDECRPDIGEYSPETGWVCLGSEWEPASVRPFEVPPVKFILNGAPLPTHDKKAPPTR